MKAVLDRLYIIFVISLDRIFVPYQMNKLLVFLVLGIIQGCGAPGSVTDLIIDLHNATRAKIQFKTVVETSASIEFWHMKNGDHFEVSETSEGYHHEIVLLNLKPATTYSYVLKIRKNNKFLRAAEGTFHTDSLPGYLPSLDLIHNEGNVFSGFILIRNVQPPGQQILINNLGEIVWYQVFDTTLFRPFSWTDQQSILALKSDREIHEFNLKGDSIFNLKYGEGGFTELLHHEILRDQDRNIISLTRNDQLFDLSLRGGDEADTIKGDGILRLDSMGNKIWYWDIFEFIDPLQDENIMDTKADWSHANSLSIAADGNYLISFRHFNQVWKINSKTGRIIWKLGENGDFSIRDEQVFYLQHSAHINSLGEIMLFDNGGPERFTSRAVSFKLDTINHRVIDGKINVFLPKSLFSFKQGSAYLIDGDKVLICSSIKKSILVTDLEGQILWQLNLSESVYRADYVDTIDWGWIKLH